MNSRLRTVSNRLLIALPCFLAPMSVMAEPNQAGQGAPRDRGLTMLALATPVAMVAGVDHQPKRAPAPNDAGSTPPDPLGLKLLIHWVTVGQ